MNKQTLITLIAIGLISVLVIGIGYAIVNFTNTATLLEDGSVTYELDGNPFNSGTIAWGDFTLGEIKTKTLDVNNNMNIPIQTTITATVPDGWTYTWTLNGSNIPAFTSDTGVLSLTAPSDGTPGTISFTAVLSP